MPIHVRTIHHSHAPSASGPTILPPFLETSSPMPPMSLTRTTLQMLPDQRA